MIEPDQTEHNESPAEAAPALIREASDIWVEICGFFGAPHELYRRAFHYPRSHRLATDWIRCLEILVRRIALYNSRSNPLEREDVSLFSRCSICAKQSPLRLPSFTTKPVDGLSELISAIRPRTPSTESIPVLGQ